MVYKFSVWLRETARLYLRYMAVGLATIPFALGYVLAAHQKWFIFPLLVTCALIAAFLVLRRLNWQIRTQAAVAPLEAEWAELMKAALQSGPPLQYRMTIDEDTLRRWQEVLTPAAVVSSDAELGAIAISVNRGYELGPVQMLTYGHIEGLQQMMMGKGEPPRQKAQKVQRDISKQSDPALAFQLGRQPLTAGMHG